MSDTNVGVWIYSRGFRVIDSGYREIAKNERSREDAHPKNIIHIMLPLSSRRVQMSFHLLRRHRVTRTSDSMSVWWGGGERELYNIRFTLLQHQIQSSVWLAADRRGIYRYHVSGINSFDSAPSLLPTYIYYYRICVQRVHVHFFIGYNIIMENNIIWHYVRSGSELQCKYKICIYNVWCYQLGKVSDMFQTILKKEIFTIVYHIPWFL